MQAGPEEGFKSVCLLLKGAAPGSAADVRGAPAVAPSPGGDACSLHLVRSVLTFAGAALTLLWESAWSLEAASGAVIWE